VISTENSALGLTYLTLTPDSTLEPACAPSGNDESQATAEDADDLDTAPLLKQSDSAPTLYVSQSWRTGKPFVGVDRVKDWDRFGTGPEGGDGFLAECEREYKGWKAKRSEGTDDVAKKREANLRNTGVKTD
jgi:hypothetical protein